MKKLILGLITIALVAAVSAQTLRKGATWKRVVPAAGGNTIYLDEDFEETGTPTGNTWDLESTVPDFDDTTFGSPMVGENMKVASSGNVTCHVEFTETATGNVYVKGIIEMGGGLNKLVVGLRDSGDANRLALYHEAADTMSIYINGAADAGTTTFVQLDSTIYYFWMDWVPNGTCYVGMSTTDSKPAAGTDTSTAFGQNSVSADSSGASITDMKFYDINSNHHYDNLLAQSTEI